MFLNGGAMRGGELHHLLEGAPLLAETRTAPRYRFFSVGDRFPGLRPVTEGGASIAGELYDLGWELLRERLLPAEPPELELGVIELADGSPSLAMLLRRPYTPAAPLTDITATADWRAHLRTLGERPR
ncbi:allophanate hydrolase-related protein [Allonocardiopsis opalescens]